MQNATLLGSLTSLLMIVLRGAVLAAEPAQSIVFLKEFENPNIVEQVGFSKDGRCVIDRWVETPNLLWGSRIDVWEISTAKRLRRFEIRTTTPFRFTTMPHARLCYWVDGGIDIQDNLLNDERRHIELKDFGPAKEMSEVSFSADDKILAGIRNDDQTLNVWNVASGQRLARLALPQVRITQIRSIAFSPTCQFVGVGIDVLNVAPRGGVIVWDIKTQKQVLQSEEEFRVFQLAFFGDSLAYGGMWSRPPAPGTIVIRTGEGFRNGRIKQQPSSITSLVMISSNRLLTGSAENHLELWDTATLQQIGNVDSGGRHMVVLAYRNESNLIAVGNYHGPIGLWKIETASDGVHQKE